MLQAQSNKCLQQTRKARVHYTQTPQSRQSQGPTTANDLSTRPKGRCHR